MEIIAAIVIFFGVVAFIAAMIGVSAVLNGWVLTKLWHWFVVPIFGFHDLNLVQAIGLALIVGFMTKQYVPSKKNKDGETDYSAWAYLFIAPFVSLLFGYIVHLFM